MMRVLFTNQPMSGHWHPLVPLAQALESAGHEVAFASLPGYCSTIEAKDFRTFPVGADATEEEAQQINRQLASCTEPPPSLAVLRYVFAGIRADRMLPDMLDLINDWHPDVLVREHTELTACVAAERTGIPHVVFQIGALVPWFMRAMTAPLNRLLASVGLTTGEPADILFRYLMFYPRPLSLWNSDLPMPPTLHTFRYTGFSQSGDEALPDWVAALDEQPTVYATLGTVMNDRTDLLAAIVDGLREEPINLILTVGRNRSPQDFGEQPTNVHIERYIPQNMLLPFCDMVVTHGGSGTMLDALSFGLPMVMIPIAADQPVNARLCARLGVAREVTPVGRTEAELAQDIRNATQEVLRNPTYRENAQWLRKEMEDLPGLEYPVSLLETLAAKRTPLIAHPHTN
jgi:UDP:flavonoid glycosyltransferase YjiC (YdhE family)